MSELFDDTGVELPTHTTSHNQVIAVPISAPSQEVLDNYLALKNERDLSWDQVADLVAGQDPALASYLRQYGADHEIATAVVAPPAALLTELAVNPLSTPEDRALATGADPVDDSGAHAAADDSATAATKK